MQSPLIRPARETEITEILGLLGELGRPCHGGSPAPVREAAEEILSRPDTEILVAELDGRLLGLACLLTLPRLGHASLEARLLDLVVSDDARAARVGRRLVEAVVERATASGCHLLRLECGHHRTGAQGFYRHLGFESRGEDWQLPLATGAEPA
jgi:ribosomal protein S18 acetylase RimI-like enzyme